MSKEEDEYYKAVSDQAKRVVKQIVHNRPLNNPPRGFLLSVADLMGELIGSISIIKQQKKQIEELEAEINSLARQSNFFFKELEKRGIMQKI